MTTQSDGWKLDLDGTAGWEQDDKYAVSMALDGTIFGTCQRIIGDYNHIPFAADVFQRAFGCCYLEGSDGAHSYMRYRKIQELKAAGMSQDEISDHWDEVEASAPVDPMNGQNDFSEIARVLKPGGTAKLGSCGSYSRYRKGIQSLVDSIRQSTVAATKAGLEIQFEYEERGDWPRVSEPWVLLQKPGQELGQE